MKDDRIKCEVCGKIFFSPTGFGSHLRTHLLTGKEYYDRLHADENKTCPCCKVSERDFISVTKGYKCMCKKCCNKITKMGMIIRYGEEEGNKRWEHYRSLQAKTNTFEYKKDKYGWTKEQFNDYNKSRAVTLDNLKRKHGDSEGEKIFNDYCKQQAYTNTKEYFVKKYGKISGEKKYEELNKKKGLTLENFIVKYGKEDGAKRYSDWVKVRRETQRYWSKVSKEFFDRLVELVDFGTEVHYADSEIGIYDKNLDKYSKYDFVDTKNKIIIEFNGHCFHAKCEHDPEFRNWIHPEETSEDAWVKDVYKKELAEKHGYRYFVVWEEDFYADKDKTVANMAKLVKETLYA